jgi:uncharacterized protein
MVVGVCKLSLMIEGSASLKEKRQVLRHIKDKVQNKFNCAIAEVGDQDLLQSAELGFAVVSNELGFTQSMVQKILQYVEDLAVAKVTGDEQDFVHYGDGSLETGKDHWEPEEPSPMGGGSRGFAERGGTGRSPPDRPSKTRPRRPQTQSEAELPEWLPARFLESKDPEK